MNGKEKRKYERIDVTLESTVGTNNLICSNFILNISLGGVCIECGKPIELGTKVQIIIPTNIPLKISGKVVWCKKEGLHHKLGIKFNKLDEEQKHKLKELISSLFWQDQAKTKVF